MQQMIMNEKDNNSRAIIWAAVIGAVATICTALFTFMGTVGSSYINNIDKFRQEKKKEEQGQNSAKKQGKQAGFPKIFDEKHNGEIFDTSIFLFKKRRFIEDEPVLFMEGKVSLKIFSSSERDCKMLVSQFFSEKQETVFNLVKGSSLPVSIGGKEYVFYFIDGQYRQYCIIDSYYHGQ